MTSRESGSNDDDDDRQGGNLQGFHELLRELDEEQAKQDREWKTRHVSFNDDLKVPELLWPESSPVCEELTENKSSLTVAYNDELRLERPKRLISRRKKPPGFAHARFGRRALRFFGTNSGKRTSWTFYFNSDEGARFYLLRRLLESKSLQASESERLAILVFVFGERCETGQLTAKELCRRFKIKYARFSNLLAQFEGTCRANRNWLRSNEYLGRHRAIGIYEKDDVSLIRLYYLRKTGDIAVYNRAFHTLHVLPQWRRRFNLLSWETGAIPL